MPYFKYGLKEIAHLKARFRFGCHRLKRNDLPNGQSRSFGLVESIISQQITGKAAQTVIGA